MKNAITEDHIEEEALRIAVAGSLRRGADAVGHEALIVLENAPGVFEADASPLRRRASRVNALVGCRVPLA